MNKYKVNIIVLLLIISNFANAQIIDNYGIRIGTGLSNQHWKYKHELLSELSGWHDNKTCFSGQVITEKFVGKYFSINSAIGYFQKGYIDDITIPTMEDEDINIKNNNVIFHNISFDISTKYKFLQTKIQPYFLLGFRSNYLIDYQGSIIEFQGEEHEMNTDIYDDFSNFTISGLVG